ncbi:MAG: PDC sensor domain-containing protein [Angustibacter sp.]
MSAGLGPVATQPSVAAPADVVAAVDAIGTRVERLLDGLRAAVSASFAGRRPARADLRVVEPAAAMLRLADLPLVGAGFVAAPGALADAPYWLEWFTTDHDVDRPTVEPLDAQTDPEADDFRDYTALAWFSGPREDGEAHVTGPYVDYLCTDEYTLTFTQPVVVDDVFVGVVGADLFARSMEAAVLPVMGRLPGASMLVNASGRVVAACRTAWVTGDLVREAPAGWQRHLCAALPFALLVATT